MIWYFRTPTYVTMLERVAEGLDYMDRRRYEWRMLDTKKGEAPRERRFWAYNSEPDLNGKQILTRHEYERAICGATDLPPVNVTPTLF
jgi:hypothetical protein